jgi:hypothetical protein
MEQRGCGYGIEAKLADGSQAAGILNREGIAYRKVYRLTQDGALEESV